LTSVRYEDVSGLNVAMDDSLRMGCVQGIRDLDAEIEHRADLQRLARDHVPERPPF
jgi:hypothetical protein